MTTLATSQRLVCCQVLAADRDLTKKGPLVSAAAEVQQLLLRLLLPAWLLPGTYISMQRSNPQ
jgi:hypothetical protein